MEAQDDLISQSDLQELWGCSSETIRRRRKAGVLHLAETPQPGKWYRRAEIECQPPRTKLERETAFQRLNRLEIELDRAKKEACFWRAKFEEVRNVVNTVREDGI